MKRNKNGNWDNKRRNRNPIPIGKAILMIYCGKCTEPEYFGDALKTIKENKEKASRGITKFIYKEKPLPVDPKSMAESVVSIMKSFGLPFDEVYVVFDKDSFKDDNFDNAVMMINNLNTSKDYHSTSFIPLWSNQCIELWFILHFEYLQSKNERADYFDKLKELLNLKHKYRKNTKGIYAKVSSSRTKINDAIRNANKLLILHKDESSFANKFPATNVVEFFKKYKDSL